MIIKGALMGWTELSEAPDPAAARRVSLRVRGVGAAKSTSLQQATAVRTDTSSGPWGHDGRLGLRLQVG